MDYNHNRNNILTKTIKNRRPRRDYNYYKILLLLIYSVITVTLVKRRVYIDC